MSVRFEGTFTALVTPFKDDESIDWDAFDKLVDAQIQGGVSGLVPCGTTGESPTLEPEEEVELIRRCVKAAHKNQGSKCLVVAGTGSNSTKTAIQFSQEAAKVGVDAVMVVTPYYNKPTQDGMFHHFTSIAAAVDVPVVVYNIPGRCVIDLATDTLARIVEKSPNIAAVKDATGNVLRCSETVRRFGSRLAVLSGDDGLTLPMIAMGAKGVISVTSNVLPAEVSKTTRLALEGRMEEARREHLALMAVHEAMFIEANPACPKAALAHLGRMKDVVRGPLVKCSEAARAKVIATLNAYESRGKGG
jgi:4-hydroxy-tetrahydrodipicolinate synthase